VIDAQTKVVGVMGWPIAHSLSPAMHNAAFDALGLNWRYVAFPVPPDQVGQALEGLKALGFCGTNVTVPHKEAVIPYLDRIPERVRRFGAVNTILVERDEEGACALVGDNSDVQGFLRALRQGGFEPQGRQVTVVGAGGGARGVVYGLCIAQAAEVTVLNRTPERAERLASDMAAHAEGTALRALPLSERALLECAAQADLLVNTTTVGMWPHVEASIWPQDTPVPAHLAVCDLVYRPLRTRLLEQAQRGGATTIDGLGMLIAQGAISFEMWTGQWPPEEVMRAVCEGALAGEGQ
jgi:shikimate dehydrogenase